MYKIETHLHTARCSHCGQLSAREIVEGYKAAGYSALVVTDHYNRDTFEMLGVDLASREDKLCRFLEGFRLVQEEGARAGLTVLPGAEVRFDECMNDYLVYGLSEELLGDPEMVFSMGIAAFAPVARRYGALIIQAHPYRHACTPAIACYLDGVETINGNPRHNNHNDWAEAYARAFDLLRLAGSDCHQPEDIGGAGILAQELPETPQALIKLIRSGRYTLLERGV